MKPPTRLVMHRTMPEEDGFGGKRNALPVPQKCGEALCPNPSL
jgi:hypothetical protein